MCMMEKVPGFYSKAQWWLQDLIYSLSKFCFYIPSISFLWDTENTYKPHEQKSKHSQTENLKTVAGISDFMKLAQTTGTLSDNLQGFPHMKG